jgi:hypothetical protein
MKRRRSLDMHLPDEARPNPCAVALGRRGGQSKSEAKKAAARDNGRMGGRPPMKGKK